jgi:hypothetical protein
MIRLKTKVLPGNRVEVIDPNLPESATVEVIVLTTNARTRVSLYDWMCTAPPADTPRAVESWEKYERLSQQERNAW